MDFIVTAHDFVNQVENRMANREAHLVGLKKAINNGNIISAGAITNENGEMIGSSLHVRFETREQLDEWLKQEPYVTGKVWEKVCIENVKLIDCLLYTSPSPRDKRQSRMPSSA